METTALAVIVALVMGYLVGFGRGKKKGRGMFLLLAVLLAGSAQAAELTLPVSLTWLPGYTYSFSWAEPEETPTLDAQVHATLGLAAGLGWRARSGAEISGQLLFLREDMDARWVLPDFAGAVLQHSADRNRVGLVVNLSVPIGR